MQTESSEMFGLFGKHKPVKLRSYKGDRKYGVAAKDVKELLKKGCKLLQVRSHVVLLFLLCFLFSGGTSTLGKQETHSYVEATCDLSDWLLL